MESKGKEKYPIINKQKLITLIQNPNLCILNNKLLLGEITFIMSHRKYSKPSYFNYADHTEKNSALYQYCR